MLPFLRPEYPGPLLTAPGLGGTACERRRPLPRICQPPTGQFLQTEVHLPVLLPSVRRRAYATTMSSGSQVDTLPGSRTSGTRRGRRAHWQRRQNSALRRDDMAPPGRMHEEDHHHGMKLRRNRVTGGGASDIHCDAAGGNIPMERSVHWQRCADGPREEGRRSDRSRSNQWT